MLEKAGIPAIPVLTDAFDSTAREMAQLWGVPDFRFVMMPHPLASLSEAQVDQASHRACRAHPQLAASGTAALKHSSEFGLVITLTRAQPSSLDTSEPAAEACAAINVSEQIELCFAREWTDEIARRSAVTCTRARHASGSRARGDQLSRKCLHARLRSQRRKSRRTPSWRAADRNTCRWSLPP